MTKYNDSSLYKKVDDFLSESIPETFDDLSDGTTNKAFTETLKSKLDGISSGATANSLDAALLARANHTGAQAISTVTGLDSALTGLAARVTALETWQSNLKINRLETFSVTTDSSGDFTVTTSTAFTNPIALAGVRATAGAEGYHAHINSVSGATITGRAFKNKTQGVLIGGTIDPDNPVAASTQIRVIVVEPL